MEDSAKVFFNPHEITYVRNMDQLASEIADFTIH